jgi:hypothetical protein
MLPTEIGSLIAVEFDHFIEERCGEDDDNDEDLCIYGVGELRHTNTVTPTVVAPE